MAINPNNGVLDIINGTLRVSSIDIKQAGGFTTAINTVARNDVLLYDDQDANTTFTPTRHVGYSSSSGVTRDTTAIDFNDGWVYWPLQLPNSWHTEFDILIPTTGGVLTYSLFNTSEPNHTDYTANDGGYKIVFDNTQNQIDVLWEGSVHATTSANVRSADWQHVNINYFQGAVSISLAGKVVLTHKFTENYQEFDSRYVGFSATSGASHKIRHLIVHNSDKWLYTKTSNASDISYVSGNVGIGSLSPTELLDVHGNVHIAKDLTVDGNLTVSGTTTFIDTQNLAIEDPIIEVARGNASDTIDAGLVITRASSNVAVAYRGDEEELALGYTQSGASDTDVTPIADGGLSVRVYGNLFANNLTTTANVEATYLKGNGSEITHVTLDQVVDYGNTTANTIHLTNTDVGLKADGNIEANYFIGNGSQLDGISSTLQEITDNGNVTTNTIQFTNTTTALVADSNVGIGTDAPSANLHIVGHQYVNDPPTVANSFDHSDAPLTLTHGTPTSTTAIDDPNPVLHLTRDGTSGQAYGARASFNLSRYENSGTSSRSRLDVALTDGTYAESNVMSIRADGKVGIGTTTPGYTLDVHGTANVGALTATSVSGNGSGLTSLNAGNITSGTLGTARIPNLDASKITTGTLSRPISTTTGTFSGDVEVTGELTTKSNVFLGVMSAHEKEGTLEFGRADGADRVHNIKVYNSSTQANNYMKFQIHAGGASAGTVTDNVLYLRGDGNVGIGTNSPGQKLEVGHYGGALSSDFGAIRITNHATNLHATSLARFDISLGNINSGTGSGNRKLIFNSKTTTTDSGTDILCLDGQTNNVGIGTDSPRQKLEVANGSIAIVQNNYKNGADDDQFAGKIDFHLGGNADELTTPVAGIEAYDKWTGGSYFGALAFKTMNSEKMRIATNGNVGIGTANPEASLHVQGARSIFGNNGGASDIVINDVPTARWKIATGGYALIFSKHNSASDEYSTWSEKVRIDQNGNVGIGTDSPTAQLTLGASSGSQIQVTNNTRLLSNTHYLSYTSGTSDTFEQVLLQFDTGETGSTDQSEYAGYVDVEMVAQRTQSLYLGPEIFTARLNFILGWNEQADLWRFTTFIQENKGVSEKVADDYTIFQSVPVFKYKYVDRQLQIYVSFDANYFRGYTSFTARVTSDNVADVSTPGANALMASGTVGTAEVGICYGVGTNAANVGIGTTNPSSNLHVNGDVYVSSNLEVGTANLFVDTQTGNVGIRTESPSYKLDVHGTANVGAVTLNSNVYAPNLPLAEIASNLVTWNSATGDLMDSGGLISNKLAIVSEQPPAALTYNTATSQIDGHGKYVIDTSRNQFTTYTGNSTNAFHPTTGGWWSSAADYTNGVANTSGTFSSLTDSGGTTHYGAWASLKLPYKTILRHVKMNQRAHSTGRFTFPSAVTVLGSNDDGATKVLIQNAISVPSAADYYDTQIVVDASEKYRTYYFSFPTLQESTTYIQVGKIRLYTETFTVDAGVVSTTAASGLDVGYTEHPVEPMTDYHTYVEGHGTYEASASSYDSTYSLYPWEAFDDDTSTRWTISTSDDNYNVSTGEWDQTAIDASPDVFTSDVGGTRYHGHWLQIKLPYTVTLSHTNIHPQTIERAPKDGAILGSNDGEHWYKLTEFSGKTYTASTWTRIDVNATTPYQYFRMSATKNGGDSKLELTEWRLFAEKPVTRMENVHISGDLSSETLQTGYIKWPKVPLKAVESEGYVASASSGTSFAYKAFNNTISNANDVWNSASVYTNGIANGTESFEGVDGSWIKIKLPQAIQLSHFNFYNQIGGYSLRAPRTGRVWASNDDVNWTQIGSFSQLSGWVERETKRDEVK